MRAYSCLVILAVVSLPAQLLVSAESSEADNMPAAQPATSTPICEETVCPRLYMPVCGLVDGEPMTAPSRCVLNNKIRCSAILQRTLGNKIPTVSFLHSGPCSPKAYKSIRMRQSRDMDLENIEDDAGKEEIDATQADLVDKEALADDAEADMDAGNEEIVAGGEESDAAKKEIDATQADLVDKEALADDAEADMDAGNEEIVAGGEESDAAKKEIDATQADLVDKEALADDAEGDIDHAKELNDEE
uniref:Kazal-like domain-containing protein n=2 Tax=Bactrocera latifrons TaxID=174628 RepID=A0A0K8U6K8_BACLA